VARVYRFRCRSCGVSNPADMKYCGQCAAALVPRCTHCKFQNPPQSKFCGQCAASLPMASSDTALPSDLWVGAFIVLSIVVSLSADALYSASLDGRFSTKLGTMALLFAGVAPAFIALFLAAAEDGYDGVERLLSPMLIWRVSIHWYLAATVMPILVGLAAGELSSIQGYILTDSAPPLPPLWVSTHLYRTFGAALPVFWIEFLQLTGGFGYCLRRLQETHGALTSALVLGAVAVIASQAPALLGLPAPAFGFDIDTPWLIPSFIGGAVWITWIYNSTKGSLLLATLGDAAGGKSWCGFFPSRTGNCRYHNCSNRCRADC
jgi:Double zinc ribbon